MCYSSTVARYLKDHRSLVLRSIESRYVQAWFRPWLCTNGIVLKLTREGGSYILVTIYDDYPSLINLLCQCPLKLFAVQLSWGRNSTVLLGLSSIKEKSNLRYTGSRSTTSFTQLP